MSISRNVVRDAFLKDKESLFTSFRLKRSLRFQDFASCWRDMRFSLVLYGKPATELRDFLEDAFFFCLEDMQIQKDIDQRVFGLYLMYSLFMKQPSTAKTSIRLSKDAWNDVKNLLSFAQENKHLDLLCVWTELRKNQAVDFVYSIKYFGPFYAKDQLKETSREVSESAEQLKQAVDPQLADLASFFSHYESLKQDFQKHMPEDMMTSGGNNPFVELREDIEFTDGSKTSFSRYSLDPDSLKAVCEAKQEEEEDIGAKRMRLKYRTMPEPPSKYSK